jgi:hypothetical protein
MYHFDIAGREYPDLNRDLGNDTFMFLFCVMSSRAMRETMREFNEFLFSIEVDLKEKEEQASEGLVGETIVIETEIQPKEGDRKLSVDTTGSFSVGELYEGSVLQKEFQPKEQKLNSRQFLDMVRGIQNHPKLAVYLNSLISYFEDQIVSARAGSVPKNRPYLDQGWVEFKKVLSNLANDFDFDPLDNYLTFFCHVLQKDQDFAEIVSMWVEFIHKLGDYGYSESEQATFRGANLIQQTQKHLHDNYLKETLAMIREIHTLVGQLLNDPESQQMVRVAESVHHDLFLSE